MSGRLIPGVSVAEYEAMSGVNFSRLRHMSRSPAHYRYVTDHPDAVADTPSLRLGRAVHVLALMPDDASSLLAVAPDVDRRTKEGRVVWEAFLQEAGSREIVRREEYEQARAVADAVRSHAGAGPIITCPGLTEVAAVWDDPGTGIACKGRMDRVLHASRLIVDLKTTADAGLVSMEWSARRYMYDAQAAYYVDGLAHAGHPGYSYVIVAVETSPPHAVAVYAPTDALLDRGRRLYSRWLERLHECERTGEWPGYPAEVQPLGVPRTAAGVPAVDDETPF